MSHGVLYFCWRAGRPRWIPPKKLRDLGYKGSDIKDDNGLWLPLEAALQRAREINERIRQAGHALAPATHFIERRQRAVRRAEKKAATGYVYFVRCRDHIKIGFSIRPIYRVAAIVGAHPDPFTSLIVVPGTEREERGLHAILAEHRTGGEWFAACRHVLNVMTRCVHAQHVVLAKTTPHAMIGSLKKPRKSHKQNRETRETGVRRDISEIED